MKRWGMLRKMVSTGAVAGMLTVGLVAALPATPSAAASSTPTTATYAEQPQTAPDYIFPFMSLAFFSVANIEPVPVPDVPAALLVRERQHAQPQSLPVAGRQPRLLEQRHHSDGHPQAVQVVQR